MEFYPGRSGFRLHYVRVCIVLALCGVMHKVIANDSIQFNTDILDIKDRQNIDLSQFSRAGYIMPGDYTMIVFINKSELPEQSITFYEPDNDKGTSTPCLNHDLVEQIGLKAEAKEKLTWWHNGECVVLDSLKGMVARGDLSTGALYLNIPQAYLEYTSADWDPPSRWDEGIPGLLLDYNINGQTQRSQSEGSQQHYVNGNGTTGVNIGAWRFRADWQAQIRHQSGGGNERRLDWSRYYAYRAISGLRSHLSLGENYLYSDMFDSFRFTGVSLRSDDSMLPPNLRGYAPEVVGVAKTNATVTISQQGRVIYETQVAAGPFRIQDLYDSVSGELDVKILEQDGTEQKFTMNTANIPYLSRPGSIRYKFSSGRPTDWQHKVNGPMFAVGEMSWGVNSGWSLYGGALGGNEYQALTLGVGRDLMVLGALSFDATQSSARFGDKNSSLRGGSYRVSYSKTFDELDSQVTFAGYRFSDKNFMSMSEYLDARNYGGRVGSNKEMYTITFNQQLTDLALSLYLNYNHQTYWDRPKNDRYSLSVARYFDFMNMKNMSLSLTGYRNNYQNTKDDGMYLSLSVPWGNSGNISYNASVDRNNTTNRVSYSGAHDQFNRYQVSVGNSRQGTSLDGYASHAGDIAEVSGNVGFQEGGYSAVGLSLQGGGTLTAKGGALHRIGMPGGTRLMLDTSGVENVPVRGYGDATMTNRYGKAVVTDVNNYYRNSASIDLNLLGDKAEAVKSVVQATLTEGAIGYRRFEVISGEKAMAVVKFADGSSPPFGATATNATGQETGIMNDGGSIYLSGIRAEESMTLTWGSDEQCQITFPKSLPKAELAGSLLLPCTEPGPR